MSAAGTYKHRVRFDRAIDTVDDATGEPMRMWEVLGTFGARVESLLLGSAARGREGIIGGGVESEVDTVITTRYSSLMATVRAKDRAYFPLTDTYYNIEVTSDVGNAEHKELQFKCTSGLNAG